MVQPCDKLCPLRNVPPIIVYNRRIYLNLSIQRNWYLICLDGYQLAKNHTFTIIHFNNHCVIEILTCLSRQVKWRSTCKIYLSWANIRMLRYWLPLDSDSFDSKRKRQLELHLSQCGACKWQYNPFFSSQETTSPTHTNSANEPSLTLFNVKGLW